MDESQTLSWRAQLARANINILDLHNGVVFFEFTYHPKPGVFKWCKTIARVDTPVQTEDLADCLIEQTLKLRKELEG